MEDRHKIIQLNVILAIVLLLSFIVLRPYILTLILSAVFAYIIYPLFVKLNLKIKDKNYSSIITVIAFFIIILIPTIFFVQMLTFEVFSFYATASSKLTESMSINEKCTSNFICEANNFLSTQLNYLGLDQSLRNALKNLVDRFVSATSSFIFSLPSHFISIFIFFFSLFYFLKDGPQFVEKVKVFLPFSPENQTLLVDKFSNITRAILFGYIITALIQGFVAFIGYLILGIDNSLFLGFLTAIAALIPFIGTALIWIPITVSLLLNGMFDGSFILVIKAIILAIYGIFVIGLVDNLYRPKLIGQHAHIHTLIVLIGIIGGLSVFGLTGLIVGPMILVFGITLLDIYKKERLI